MTVYNRYAAITKSDTADIPQGPTDAIFIGSTAGGAIVVAVLENNQTVQFTTCIAGTILPIRAKRINNTTTTAADLVALYRQ